MKITYKLVDGNIVYDVTEAVMSLTINFTPEGEITLAQVVRRQFFSISGTPVKEFSAPAQAAGLEALKDEKLLPTALNVTQVTTAMLLRFLQMMPEITGQKDVELPTLPGDLGASVAAAKTEFDELQQSIALIRNDEMEAGNRLSIIQSQVSSAQSNLTYLESGLKQMAAAGDEHKLQLAQEIETLEARKNSCTDTITVLEDAIRRLSEESTVLQNRIADSKTTIQP